MTKNDDLPIDLKPCPFCGEQPEIVIRKVEYQQTTNPYEFSFAAAEGESIACTNKMCGMQPATHPCRSGSLIMFISNWNDRADSAGEIERLD